MSNFKQTPKITTLMAHILISSCLITSCGGGSEPPPSMTVELPPLPPPPQTTTTQSSISFRDVTERSNISFEVGFDQDTRLLQNEVAEIFTSGVAAGDYDKDGDIDLFIVRGNSGPNRLYRNDGDLRFTDVSAFANVDIFQNSLGTGRVRHGSPAFADMDGDGDLDIFIGALFGDPIVILSNNDDGTFTDVSATAGFENMIAAYSHSPSFGDYDGDGDLDLMLGHWGTVRDRSNIGDTEHLWRNNSDEDKISFESVTIDSGISPSIINNNDPLRIESPLDLTFSPSFVRINDDIWPDILLTSDLNSSQVFINNRDGTFSNETNYGVIIDGNGMGSAVGDYDADGDLDWFVSSIKASNFPPESLSELGNRLYRNDLGSFTDVTDEAGVADGGWGWGSCFVDLDNDSNLDIYHTNGWFRFEEFGGFPSDNSRAFISNGNGSFTEKATEIGLNDQERGRGIICADFDNDGDSDILQLHSNDDNAATLWENATDNNANYLTIKLVGRAPNTEAIGARIKITRDGKNQYRDVTLASNFASHNPTYQNFGLGEINTIESVTITWPDGTETLSRDITVNQTLTIQQE